MAESQADEALTGMGSSNLPVSRRCNLELFCQTNTAISHHCRNRKIALLGGRCKSVNGQALNRRVLLMIVHSGRWRLLSWVDGVVHIADLALTPQPEWWLFQLQQFFLLREALIYSVRGELVEP